MLIRKLKKFPDDHSIIFNHVPKAGGTTLIDFFRGVFGEEHVFRHRHRPTDSKEYTRAITKMTKEDLAEIRFAAGHFDYGHHALFPNPVLYLGVVREPIERLVSDYNYNRVAGREDLRKMTNEMSLNEYAEFKLKSDGSRLVTSSQLLYLTGQTDLEAGRKIIAKEYLVACTTEQLDMCQIVLRHFFRAGGKPLKSNKSKPAFNSRQLDPELRTEINKRTRDDRKLVKIVERQFNKSAVEVLSKVRPVAA